MQKTKSDVASEESKLWQAIKVRDVSKYGQRSF